MKLQDYLIQKGFSKEEATGMRGKHHSLLLRCHQRLDAEYQEKATKPKNESNSSHLCSLTPECRAYIETANGTAKSQLAEAETELNQMAARTAQLLQEAEEAIRRSSEKEKQRDDREIEAARLDAERVDTAVHAAAAAARLRVANYEVEIAALLEARAAAKAEAAAEADAAAEAHSGGGTR